MFLLNSRLAVNIKDFKYQLIMKGKCDSCLVIYVSFHYDGKKPIYNFYKITFKYSHFLSEMYIKDIKYLFICGVQTIRISPR